MFLFLGDINQPLKLFMADPLKKRVLALNEYERDGLLPRELGIRLDFG